MSWSVATAPAVSAIEMGNAIAKLEVPEGTYPPGMLEAMQAACSVAKQALLLMFHSGVYGPDNDPTVFYRASASGHANPGGRPLTGWSDDFVNVQLTQVRMPKPPTEAEDEAIEPVQTAKHAPSVV